VTAIQRSIIPKIGHFEPTTDRPNGAPLEPEAHRDQPFQGGVSALPIGEGGHFHDVLAQEKVEQIDAVGVPIAIIAQAPPTPSGCPHHILRWPERASRNISKGITVRPLIPPPTALVPG
jgi:hypothetical protein